MVKIKMNQQRKLSSSRHGSRQSSIGETASVCSIKSAKSNGSAEHNPLSAGQLGTNNKSNSNNNNNVKQINGLTNNNSKASNEQSGANILNVAEMLLHGVADNEILDIWLRSIQCEEFVAKFIDSGYDMPTLSRITPQDLTAIGVTEPSKRLKILTEIKKLNLQDGIPSFKPTSLSHWLSLIRLDSYYYKSLCDQQIDTIEKMCQLTWEDFEELGITKLGHQKRFQLAIERVKELDSDSKCSSKAISEPIYDTNPSQILLVASAENHSMNGPIINKQSSTSELSSTGSGSMHSVYSAASTHYQPTYAPMSDNQQPMVVNNIMPNINPNQAQQQQAIYSQPPPPPMIYQQPSQLAPALQPLSQQQSHYKPVQQHQPPIQSGPPQFIGLGDSDGLNGALQQNRQSMRQLPFSALARLPKHQQQLLQQSSIYATLSRQPSKAKQPPPPVPIRTNSLKSNSLTDETSNKQQQQQQTQQTNYQTQMNGYNTTSTSSLFRSGNRVSDIAQFNSQTMLSKNKSFSGNAHMEASRARFLDRNSQRQPQPHQHFQSQLPHQTQTLMNQNSNQYNHNLIYGCSPTNGGPNVLNGCSADDNMANVYRQSTTVSNNYNPHSLPKSQGTNTIYAGDDFDLNSDTNSTKSLIIAPSSSSYVTSPLSNRQFSGSNQDSGSSQTLYNSASSGGSNDQSLNMYNISSQSGELSHRSAATAASSCTLNDAQMVAMDKQQRSNNSQSSNFNATTSGDMISSAPHCNATTGKDDDFPPPPSPLSLEDSEDLVSMNSDSNFTDVNHGLMTFRVGS